MAPAITPISYQRFERFLKSVGCEFVHQRGSHRKWTRSDLKRAVIVPAEKELPPFVVMNNLRVLGISREQYEEILRDC